MKRSTLVVLVLFAALLAAVLLLRGKPVERGTVRLSLAALDTESVDHLLVAEGEKKVELKREGRAWKLAGDGALADSESVERALDGLKSVDTSEVVSTAADRHASFGVDGGKGLAVTASAGSKKVADLVLGNPGDGGAFVRAAGKDAVFMTGKPLRHLFPSDPKRWARLRPFETKLEDARKVEVALAGQNAWAIVPGDSEEVWKLADPSLLPSGFRFDGKAAKALANTLVTLRAKEVVASPPPAAQLGLEGDHDRLVLTTDSGPVTLHLGAATPGGDVYARVDGWDAVLALRAFQASNLRKRLADLRDLGLMAFDPALATSLRISAGSQELRFLRDQAGTWGVDPAGPQPPADLQFDPETVQRTVSSLQTLRATALAEGTAPAQTGLDAPAVTVAVGLADGSTAALELGKGFVDADKRNLVYARGNADKAVYGLGEGYLSRFTRGWEAFKNVPPPPGGNPFGNLDPETIKKLPPEVRESLEKQMQEQAQKQRLIDQLRQQQGAKPGSS
jgi:hypothetical protein